MVYILYVLLAAVVIGVSIKLSGYVDLLDKKTNLSGAFIGGVMLAAVTSLPELFTSIASTVFLDEVGLVLGNVLGSNIFNITVLGFALLLCMKGFAQSKVGQSHKMTAILTLLIYIVLFVPVMLGKDFSVLGISGFSMIILALYVYGIKNMSAEDSDESEEEEIQSDLTVKQITVRFICASIALVTASILITLVTDVIAEKLGLGTTVAGALFLGIATSLPEVSATFALVKLGNFNAMFGNIIGSNLFNFVILFVADVLYGAGTIYLANSQTVSLLFFGLINTICILGILYNKKSDQGNKQRIYRVLGAVTLLSYGMFLITSL